MTMKVYECSPYYNEEDVARLKIDEGENWVDFFCMSESDYTFKYGYKGYNFAQPHSNVIYKQLDGASMFKQSDFIGLTRKFPFVKRKSAPWHNEAVQRNFSCEGLELNDDDVVILSDIDEIIDSSYAEYLLGLVKKHKIITVKIHFTMFYLNLWSINWHEVWPGSPKDYAYRVFLIQGDYFKSMKISSNRLRDLGQQGKLLDTVYCPPEIVGFHHSWLGDEEAIYNKLMSYAHDLGDHGVEIVEAKESGQLKEYIGAKINRNESIFPGHKLKLVDRDKMNCLSAIRADVSRYDKYFI